jgi:PAS domain S-box-containing protein
VLLLPGWASAADSVLILNSYHRGKTISDETIAAIISELKPKYPGLTFLVEDMDTKRSSLERLRKPLLDFYTQKYRDVELRAVVTVDNNAFDFVMENRQTLFSGVPVVFCGFNGFEPSILDGVEGVTGVTEAIDLDATVKVALALHPNTTHLAVVCGVSHSGREILREFREYAKQLPESLQVVELNGLTAEELSAQLKGLPDSSVVLRFSFFRDSAGRSFRVDEQVGLLTEAGLPVYDFWDEGGIGSGYVGGYVVSGTGQGRVVARLLERLLAGESPEQIQVIDRSPNTAMFDKRALLRTKADMSQLPAEAVLLFDAEPFWERYRELLIGIGIAFLVLLASAVFFAVLSVQRKRHAVALSLEERKLRATLQSIGEGVVTTNTKGEVEDFNAVAERWSGFKLEDVVGRPVDEIFQLVTSDSNPVIELNSNGDSSPTTSGLLKTSDGSSLPIVRTAASISLPEGKQSGTVIVFRDMTRENELQQEIEQVRRLDALGQLAGGVAHDFNNMLGGIIGAAEILKDQIDDEDLSEFPELILESADGATELTAQLLSFARKQPVAKDYVHAHQIIDDTVGVLKRTIDRRIRISIEANAAKDVVEGDRTLLKSCLLNLGINASHAMPSGGTLLFATRELTLEAEDCEETSFDVVPGRYIELRVEDTGTGISPEVVERIFEPFFTTKELGKGTGLGLAAVFGTVQQHHGSVTVDSEPGRGTCFVVRLPLADQPAGPARTKDADIMGQGTVLVVDDETVLQKMAAKTLEALGYEVLTASDGREAIDVYMSEQGRIDVVLLDMIMPTMNGRDCLVELKRLDPNVNVIATSGFSSPTDLQEMRRLGITAQLPKPYRRADLSKAISRAICSGG